MPSSLRCVSFADVLAALDRLPLGPSSPSTPQRFTPAQTLVHCAQSIEYSMTGYPRLRSGLFRATVGKLAKRKFLGAGYMSHDVTAGIAGAADPAADADLASAMSRLRAAIASFRAFSGALGPHLAYGTCSKPDYEKLHSMHVADHLGAWM